MVYCRTGDLDVKAQLSFFFMRLGESLMGFLHCIKGERASFRAVILFLLLVCSRRVGGGGIFVVFVFILVFVSSMLHCFVLIVSK